jgi:hypothetical protein
LIQQELIGERGDVGVISVALAPIKAVATVSQASVQFQLFQHLNKNITIMKVREPNRSQELILILLGTYYDFIRRY